MPFPPPTLPIDRTNDTPQTDVHPADHNAVNGAVNDTRDYILGPLQSQLLQTIATKPSTDLAATYPMGESIMTTASTDTGWPVNQNGTAITVRNSQGATQWWYRLNPGTPDAWWRAMAATNSPWTRASDPHHCIINDQNDQVVNSGAWSGLSCLTQERIFGSDLTHVSGGLQINRAGLYEFTLSLTMVGNVNPTLITMGVGLGAAPIGWNRVNQNAGSNSAVLNGTFHVIGTVGTLAKIWVNHNAGTQATFNYRRMVGRRIAN
jgi:hypothetical protein